MYLSNSSLSFNAGSISDRPINLYTTVLLLVLVIYTCALSVPTKLHSTSAYSYVVIFLLYVQIVKELYERIQAETTQPSKKRKTTKRSQVCFAWNLKILVILVFSHSSLSSFKISKCFFNSIKKRKCQFCSFHFVNPNINTGS